MKFQNRILTIHQLCKIASTLAARDSESTFPPGVSTLIDTQFKGVTHRGHDSAGTGYGSRSSACKRKIINGQNLTILHGKRIDCILTQAQIRSRDILRNGDCTTSRGKVGNRTIRESCTRPVLSPVFSRGIPFTVTALPRISHICGLDGYARYFLRLAILLSPGTIRSEHQ